MSENTLENYYQVIFSLVQHHKYRIADIEDVYVFERDIYVDLLQAHLKKLQEESV